MELTRKHVSQMYFKGEVEQELRETARHFTFKFDGDLENFMRDVERSRVSDLYPHHQNGICTEKGIYTNSVIIVLELTLFSQVVVMLGLWMEIGN